VGAFTSFLALYLTTKSSTNISNSNFSLFLSIQKDDYSFSHLYWNSPLSVLVCVCLEPIFVLQAKFHQMGKNKLNFLNKVILGLFVAKF
jgi:hypothetical protein